MYTGTNEFYSIYHILSRIFNHINAFYVFFLDCIELYVLQANNQSNFHFFKSAEYINQHYIRLDACIINRGKLLHSALSSLQNLDRSLDKFLAWLSEAESVVETLEGEVESRRATQQLKELQADIERQTTTHAALKAASMTLLGSLAPEDALMLQLRGDEMERRWQVSRNS